jgi:cytochrome c6
VGGGNVVQPGATLSLRDLKRNGIESIEEIYDLVYRGKGKMPGYGVACTPRVGPHHIFGGVTHIS